MAGLNETPRANRIHIAFFGLRNAGKSTLVNAFAGQPVAIVSDVAGTTTDPVSKAMEILPLGPCLLTDTAGLDDVGTLGELRVKRALDVLSTADVAVWVTADPSADRELHARFIAECARRSVTVLEYRRGEDVAEFRKKVAVARVVENAPPLVADLVGSGDMVLLICPQDGSAPKGRLILPQQQVIRELLDAGCVVQVCQPDALPALCRRAASFGLPLCRLAITDSQAFAQVNATLPAEVPLTSFSVLFARAKGDLATFCRGLATLKGLRDGDVVLVAEGCTHHRQCGDIGTVKLPKAVERLTGRRLDFRFCSGAGFPFDEVRPELVIHCGGCMLTRREMLRRIGEANAAGVPITNYGLVLAAANGMESDPSTCLIARGTRRLPVNGGDVS